ncbi:hypothetical protein P43SY_006127 [Pythium insidiosum]|uniref:EF-hand domain-containing protein n=1 Tax=Pythium insidiosum TaxID=114742 RepID=A0AAD5M256_PYTIN|nr:hypothetical protein P43SY_006127 [Pythium insidiosum]
MTQRAMPFEWSAKGVPLMRAPWCPGDADLQGHVVADVRVDEQTAPSYALVITAKVPGRSGALRREVTKQHLTTIFDIVASRRDGGLVAAVATYARHQGSRSRVETAVDRAVDAWLRSQGKAPTREQLVLWLLSRLVLVLDGETTGAIALCGEPEAQTGPWRASRTSIAFSKTDRRDEEVTEGGDGEGDDGGEEDYGDVPAFIAEALSPSPPSYEQRRNTSSRRSSSHSPETEQEDITFGAPSGDHAERGDDATAQPAGEDPAPPGRRSRSQSMTVSAFRFEPASTRRASSAAVTPRNAWTDDRHVVALELHKSKADIEAARELQRKVEAVATLRRRQLLAQSQRKLAANDQKRADMRAVKQGLADAIEFHEILYDMEAKCKKTQIAAKREQERLAQSLRLALGRTKDQAARGPVLGPGPLSQVELDLWDRRPQRERESMWIYDLHGRRHRTGTVGPETSVFEAAMSKIQLLLKRQRAAGGTTTSPIDLFRRYDADSSGTLDYNEFLRLLTEASGGTIAFTADQARVFFEHFDPNGSGGVDYGELLWGFFNRRAFLKRWRQRKTRLSTQEIRQLFYRYDRVGRGALSPRDFRLALDDMGFRVTDEEAQLLALRFDSNKDGFIDYNEFHAFVNEEDDGDKREVTKEDGRSRSRSRDRAKPRPTTPEPRASASQRSSLTAMDESQRSRKVAGKMEDHILKELRDLQETQERIRRLMLHGDAGGADDVGSSASRGHRGR